jgi:hypothetical protein
MLRRVFSSSSSAYGKAVEGITPLKLHAVVRVDTHGNRFLVKDSLSFKSAKELEKYYDSMPHHQGYYVVPNECVGEELKRTD